MYTKRPWTMRQYAGFASATESNRRFHQLMDAPTSEIEQIDFTGRVLTEADDAIRGAGKFLGEY